MLHDSCQSPNKVHIHWKVKGQHGCHHGKEGTALEPWCLWTSSTDKLLYIEQQLCTAKVWHVGQSCAEASEHSKFMWVKMELQYCLSSNAMLSRHHLEIYRDKLVDARGFSNQRKNSDVSTLRWLSKMRDGQTDGQTPFCLYIIDWY